MSDIQLIKNLFISNKLILNLNENPQHILMLLSSQKY